MDQVKYYSNFLLSILLFPFLYLQGKRIKKTIPRLPEAKDPKGIFKNGERQINLISIGESTIAGVGVETHQQGFTGHLAKKLSDELKTTIHWQVIAKSGYTAKKVNDRLVPQIKLKNIDLIIIGLGGNDTFKMSSPNHWTENLDLLIKSLQSKYPKTPIIFANVPPIRDFPAFTPIIKMILGKQIDLLHHVLTKVVKKYQQVWYIEERIELKDWIKHFKDKKYLAKDFFSDGVHPSKLTYKTWGNEAAKFIIKENIIK